MAKLEHERFIEEMTNLPAVVIRKAKGKLKFEEVEDYLRDAGFYGQYAVFVNITEDSSQCGLFDDGLREGDSVILYEVNDYEQCPICSREVPMRHCPMCGAELGDGDPNV